MRRIAKSPQPEVLQTNAAAWLASFLEDTSNSYRKYRYRHADIKAALIRETHSKCAYCESKVGQNTPGDVEHKVPSSVDRSKHFEWDNLTIACTECNRRKNDYFDQIRPFLDPYNDDVEGRLIHKGPVVCWSPGDAAAEITVKILNLNDSQRPELILRKVEKISEIVEVKQRAQVETDQSLKLVLEAQLRKFLSRSSEYSAMVMAVLDDG